MEICKCRETHADDHRPLHIRRLHGAHDRIPLRRARSAGATHLCSWTALCRRGEIDPIGAHDPAAHRQHLARPVSTHGRYVRATLGLEAGECAYTSCVRRYHVTTFGCQMNSHDSERIKGMLESLGLGEASEGGRRRPRLQHLHDPREARHQALRLSRRRRCPEAREPRPRDRRRRLLRGGAAGAHLRALPARRRRLRARLDPAPGRVDRGRGRGCRRGRFGTHEHFAGDLPQHRERPAHAWVQVSMGCNSTCSYCIVPAVRGREQSRRPGDIVAEVSGSPRRACARSRCSARTSTPGAATWRPSIRTEFGELLRACDAVDGIERIRFTSPHPKDLREPVIAAMAECAAVCEHIHLPLQSGSTRILKAMRRTYSRERYLALAERAPRRDSRPRARHRHHRRLPGRDRGRFRRDARRRRGGPVRQRVHVHLLAAARNRRGAMADQVPEAVKHERLERLVEVVQRIAAERNAERVGRVEEVLVEGPSRTDRRFLRGRTRRNTTVVLRRRRRSPATSSTCGSRDRPRRRCAAAVASRRSA